MSGLYASADRHARRRYTPREYGISEAAMATEIDPVCGMNVDTTTSELWLEHNGTTYWFCSKGCLLEFRDDPETYLSPAEVQST
jgi:YHS domain-containing protein